MYRIGDDQFTVQDLQNYASERNIDFNTLISKLESKGMTNQNKVDKFSVFGFLNPENPDEYNKNVKSFFNANEDVAVTQLQKLIGPSYEIETSGVSIGEFFDPKASKNPNQVKITKKGTNNSIKIDFGISEYQASDIVKEDTYKKSSNDLFSFLSKTMSSEDISAAEQSQKEVKSIYREATGPGGGMYVSPDEKNAATVQFDDPELFSPVTQRKLVGGYTSPTTGISSGGSYQDVTTQPYERELKEAEQVLIKQGFKDPSKEKIEAQVRSVLKQQAIQSLFDKKATDFMNSDEVEETDLDAILKLGKELAKKENFETKKQIVKSEVKLNSSITQFQNDMNNMFSDVSRANQFVKIAESTTPTFLPVAEGEQTVTLKNGSQMSKSEYDSYMSSVSKAQNQMTSIYDLQDKLMQDIDNISDAENVANLIGRNYNDLDKFINNMGSGFGRIILSGAYGVSKLQSGIFGIDNQILDDQFIKVQEAQEIYREAFQKDVKFQDSFDSLESFGRFAAQEVGTQLPIFATMAIPVVGIPALGLSSSGDRWSEIVRQDRALGTETSLLSKVFQSGAYGAAEIIFDRYLTLPILQRSASMLFKGVGRDIVEGSIRKYIRGNVARQLAYAPVLESSAEGLTTITQNIISGAPVTENLDHAMFSGLMFGGVFGGAPFMKGVIQQKFSDYGSYEGYRNNLKSITDFEITLKKLNTSLKANKTKGNDTTNLESSIDFVKGEIDRLNEDNKTILKEVDKKTNNLSKKWFDVYNDATVQQEKIRIEVEKVINDNELSQAEKNQILKIAKSRFDQYQQTRDLLRDEKNFGNAYAAFRNSNKKQDKQRLEEILGLAATELNAEGKADPNDVDIDNKAREIYNRQEINKDYNSKKEQILKVFPNFQNFQNIDQAVKYIDKMNLPDADKEILKQEFQDGAYGVNIVDDAGVIHPVQVVDNMAKGDRLETRTHETGHAFFAAAFGNNKQAFDGIADQVLDFVQKRDENLYLKLIASTQRDKNDNLISEEVLTEFLELAGEGRFNNKVKGLSFFANLLNLGTKESLGQDADLNFDGETDAVNFLINLGKKLKAGTITLKDVASIKESVQIGAELRGTQAQTKAEPKIRFSKEASDRVQRIYEDQGAKGAFDIINEFKPIVNKIVDKRKDAPNFDRQLLTDEIETGQRGILDLIGEYKPESGVPLAAFINKFLPARAIEASRRVLGEEFTQDVTEAKGVAAEEVTTEVETKPRKKKIKLAERFGVTKEVDNAIAKIFPDLDISKLDFKTLKNKVPTIVGDLFGIAPKKITSLANLTKKELQAAQMFINKNADLLIAMLPEGATQSGTATGVPNTLLKAFYTKTERAKAATTGSRAGLAIQQKNNINKKDFLETFGIIDGKPDRTDRNTSARVLALANLTGKMITNQAVRAELAKTKANDKVINKIAEGKSQVMFSKDVKDFNINGTMDSVLQSHISKIGRLTHKFRTTEDVDLYVESLIDHVLPLMPRDFWFGTPNKKGDFGTQFTPSNRAVENKEVYDYYKKQIKALRNLPDKAFGKSIGVTDFSKPSYKSLFEGKGGVNVDKIIEVNKRARKIHEALWSRIYESIRKNPSHAAAIGNYFKLVSKQVNHWHRFGAEIIGYSKNPKGTAKKLYEYEHAMPATASYLYLIDGALKGYDFKSTYNPVMDNFKLIALDAAENSKIDKAGLKSKMPDGWNTIDNKWWERYFNDLVDIDPESIVTLKGDTFKKEFSIPNFANNLKGRMDFSKAVNTGRIIKDPKGITILDFDDTLATTKSLVRYTTPDGKKGTLNAEEYASTYQDLLDQGYVFDFTEFNKVVKGKLAPLFQKALKLQKKFGPKNMFVLTARPPQAAKAIFDFLKANGLNIPLKNITGLANSTSEAKALWVANKVGEGYNDFYFADDALQNVQAVKNMLDQFDVKSKVQQARIQFSRDLDTDFNDILEELTGIESFKRFDFIKARKRGANKGKFRFFIPPSHEDFIGLLYNFMGKGKRGNEHRDFFEQALVRPLNRAYREIDAAKQAVANDYKALNKQLPDVRKMLTKKTPDGDFTYQDAIRVYIWDKHGYDIPGISPVDQKNLVELVKSDAKLQSYAEAINTISKQETYVDPGPNWETGNIRIDLVDATGRVGRKTYFAEFQENADIIFSVENLNKIEAGYGRNLREALEDMLHRIKTGVNRPKGASAKPNMFMNWLNASVSGVMFFNTRSSILQQMSNVNYLNFADNNIFAAGKAFANQPQYWKDFAMIFNSDMLKQRRGGLQTDINGAELAEAIKKARPGNMFDQVAIIIGKALKLGFLPTQIGDNIAIATGGATFYRNRVNKYLKDGFPIDQAEKKAFTDFQNITQSTQQSARPDMTSAQQAMWIGKLVLNFLNTPSQYNRIIKKAGSDIINRRITPPNTTQMQSDMSNMSRILYYGAAQNLIFYGLQTALFAVMFGSDDEDEDERVAQFLKKKERVINGSIDTILRGSGIYGVAVSTLKNMAIKFLEQRAKGYNKDEAAVVMELLNFSPVVGIKARRIVNAEKTLNYNMKVIKEMETFDIDNPVWSAVTNYTQTITTAPTNKLYQKVINLRNAADSDYTLLQRILFFSGYTTWSLGLGDTKKMKDIKEGIKKKRELEKKRKKEAAKKNKPKKTKTKKGKFKTLIK